MPRLALLGLLLAGACAWAAESKLPAGEPAPRPLPQPSDGRDAVPSSVKRTSPEIEPARVAAGIADDALATAARLRDGALADNEAYAILESLTTEVGARMAGTPGDARAVAWAEAKFRELHFDKVYSEPVTFPRWRRGAESAEILQPFPHKLAVTALGGSSGTGPKGITAELADFADLAALKAARPEDVKGRIVFIGNRMARARDGSGYGPAQAARRDGAAEAAKLGALAIVIRSIGTDSDRMPHTGMGTHREEVLKDEALAAKLPHTPSGTPIVATPIPAAAVSNADADLLQHLFERAGKVTMTLKLDCGYDGGDATSANVVGELTGTEHPDRFVLIGGHLDSWDLGTGAIDDGAGVAITMAAANSIRKQGQRPRRSIRVVAFANEEHGLYGGQAYTDRHQGELAQLVLAAESDLGADRIYAVDSKVGADSLPAIRKIAEVLAPLGIEYGKNESGGGPDTGGLVKLGMPALSLRQDATRYFDWHHTANDTLDKVDKAQLDQNVAAYVVAAYLAAQAEGSF